MKIIKYILFPFVLFLDYFNYMAHLENYRFCKKVELYNTSTWIDKFYKSLKKGE